MVLIGAVIPLRTDTTRCLQGVWRSGRVNTNKKRGEEESLFPGERTCDRRGSAHGYKLISFSFGKKREQKPGLSY